MDWNHDGKHDHQDHAFYNNVIAPNESEESKGSNANYKRSINKSSSQSNSGSIGMGWLVLAAIVVLYLIIKATV